MGPAFLASPASDPFTCRDGALSLEPPAFAGIGARTALRSPALPRLRPRPEPSDHPTNSLGAVELVKRARLRGRDPVDTEGMIPFTRRYVDGPREISRRQAAAIRLAVWGGFVDVLDPVPLPDACQRVGLQRRAAKRLLQSAVFVAALEAAQADRARQEAARAPSAPLAALPPPPAPEPAGEAPEPAPALSERQDAEDVIHIAPMLRLDDTAVRIAAPAARPSTAKSSRAASSISIFAAIAKNTPSRSPASTRPLFTARPAAP